jgi:hypothetical protein
MDYLWTPWRYRYIADAGKDTGCIFCDAVAANDDEKTQIAFRGATCFVIPGMWPARSVQETKRPALSGAASHSSTDGQRPGSS